MAARYDFGRNWAALAAQLGEEHVAQACEDLRRLVGDIAGRSFLDIGCGSGLHSVAALRLGAERVLAVDYDSRCVEVSRATLRRFAPAGGWEVRRADVLKPASLPTGHFDIVYAWGVLHHTGDMWAAIRNSAALTAPGGCLAVALYRRTPFCAIWRLEKRIYASQGWLRPVMKACFTAAVLLARAVRHRDAPSFVRNYRRVRGMEFMIDVDDWLGGFPYDSVVPEKLEALLERLGFSLKRNFNTQPRLGLLGSGCGEWQFERNGTSGRSLAG